ncbi:MAG: hypothetical protein LRY43_03890 [Gammaproteobacteria bacterium]|nr:hypothetical protein [Gammaproteobacteria bacterium]
MRRLFQCIFCISSVLLLVACAPAPPKNENDICDIFREYPSWFWAAQASQARWGIPMSVQMAIMYQESHFKGNAKPERMKVLGFIPWSRPSTAYGYSQALDGTWAEYQRENGTGGHRSDFDTAIDFLGWYCHRAHIRAKIPVNNAYALYLAYHEGIGGYSRGAYKNQPYLMTIAKRVQHQADVYHKQILQCQHSLPKKKSWSFF